MSMANKLFLAEIIPCTFVCGNTNELRKMKKQTLSDRKKVATAIVQVASDLGSICSMAHAADFDTQLVSIVEKTSRRLNKLAQESQISLISLRRMKDADNWINEVHATVRSRKELNPLVSDELISLTENAITSSKLVLKLMSAIRQDAGRQTRRRRQS